MHYSEWRAESQITGYAWSGRDYIEEVEVQAAILDQNMRNERAILVRFMKAFAAADIVTGHYIRRHDLPLLSEHCARLGVPFPKRVLVSDTKCDLINVRGLGASQENLALTFGVSEAKHHMAGADWRIANGLSSAGREGTLTRVVADVQQHRRLRLALIARGLLGPPKVWTP
jgi:hypothetical protein